MSHFPSPVSVYIHIPFCKHRCAYCDFNTYAGQEALIPAYVNALLREIELVLSDHPTIRLSDYQTIRPSDCPTIKTVFFGGGTPSLLAPEQFDSILKTLRKFFAFAPDVEITIEANPGTVNAEQLKRLRETGINRVSLGVQSANTEELRMLERVHDFFAVIQSVADARKAGFDNLNLDLIYGLPQQTLASWKTTLARALDLRPEHISAYALTLEHGTPFGRWANKGLLPIPDPDLAAEMYEWAMDYLSKSGYTQYEISNWAKANSEFKIQNSEFMCRHNLQYWRSLPYLGFGAGAHGYANGYRYSNVLRIKTYIERLVNLQFPIAHFPLSPTVVNKHKQTEQDDISDYMINNLRLTEAGVSNADFKSRFGRGLLEVFPKEIGELIRDGLLEQNGESYRLTRRGRLLGNRAFQKFV
ncbi:MAG: radical SAM family heme chaperone HemW [Chloroflexi bacterium]|nr:radical SAM family heme chaperone HemW [Chloroflexota bacterium]MCA2002418.1 radical SAM family heme chaperone HemW [Chloroflexota bacterium]